MRFNQFMISNGYHRSKYDSCVYHEILNSGGVVYLLLYVDDILIVGKNLMILRSLRICGRGNLK